MVTRLLMPRLSGVKLEAEPWADDGPPCHWGCCLSVSFSLCPLTGISFLGGGGFESSQKERTPMRLCLLPSSTRCCHLRMPHPLPLQWAQWQAPTHKGMPKQSARKPQPGLFSSISRGILPGWHEVLFKPSSPKCSLPVREPPFLGRWSLGWSAARIWTAQKFC